VIEGEVPGRLALHDPLPVQKAGHQQEQAVIVRLLHGIFAHESLDLVDIDDEAVIGASDEFGQGRWRLRVPRMGRFTVDRVTQEGPPPARKRGSSRAEMADDCDRTVRT
jgi:hypothetical protein